jgi:peptidoglycan/LPS O-acetylase OafA/YrhL
MIEAGIDASPSRVETDTNAARREESRDNGNLDLLRSLAVLLVLTFHLALVLRKGLLPMKPVNLLMMGHWGVLLFFVHTSYVLMFSLERQVQRSGGGELFADFMLRRAFRLLPLSALAVMCVSSLRLPLADLPFRAAPFSPSVVFSNLLLVQNLTKTDSELVTLWSLPYEVQMYLVLPALFLLARRFRNIGPLLVIWTATTFVARVWLPSLGAVYDMPVYVPCFLSGVIGYKQACTRRRNLPFILWPFTLAAISMLYLIHPSLSVGWACCLAVGLLIPVFDEPRPGPLRRAAHLIARYSYGIYLAHIACIWISFVVLSNIPWPLQWVLFVTSVVALPVAAYHLLEAPMIELGTRIVQRRRLGQAASLALESAE